MIECQIADCGHPARAHGLCSKHYQRKYRTGDTRDRTPKKLEWAITVNLTEELSEELDRMAKKTGRHRSEIIRDALSGVLFEDKGGGA